MLLNLIVLFFVKESLQSCIVEWLKIRDISFGQK